jgi:uracil-DNA glycosylase
MGVEDFVARARQLLEPILAEPGGVLYSSSATLRRGDYYFLGLNPGGSGGESIRASLDALAARTSNAYLDECWENRRGRFKCGAHPLQRNAQRLFEALGVRLEDVCASNLIFSQSSREGGAGYPKKAHICWPVHKLILAIVQPRAIFTFGRQPFAFIARQLALAIGDPVTAGRGDWVCRVARGQSLVLLGLPHLSWYHPPDPVLTSIRELVTVERVMANSAVEQPAGSDALAAAAHRERSTAEE